MSKTDLSRRAFLAGLTTLAVGSATALTIGATDADAATETNVPTEPKAPTKKTSVEDKKVEVAQNLAPNDPRNAFNQVTVRQGRRVARRSSRRTYRRGRRVVRRTYRRARPAIVN